jgi:hypothetical protein
VGRVETPYTLPVTTQLQTTYNNQIKLNSIKNKLKLYGYHIIGIFPRARKVPSLELPLEEIKRLGLAMFLINIIII